MTKTAVSTADAYSLFSAEIDFATSKGLDSQGFIIGIKTQLGRP